VLFGHDVFLLIILSVFALVPLKAKTSPLLERRGANGNASTVVAGRGVLFKEKRQKERVKGLDLNAV
jgi:hypothetical protein